ncbi:MAG: hypothetical protein IPH07_02190 [Deltaproteobacteria bacterium]|nr:hypothetical protein [Deltaproteobacteria bacterium]MBP7288539.1 hypothetical protein [Nannocystaceae bacterium]
MVTALTLLLATTEPAPSSPTRQSAAQRAARHFDAGEWDAAIDALIEAYAEDPDPDYLYARAQAERLRGRCDQALELYRRYLAADPSTTGRADTERNIRLCEETLAATRKVEPSAPPRPPEPVPTARPTARPTAEPAPDRPHPRPRRVDALGIALTASGGAVAGVGAGLWIAGAWSIDNAPGRTTEDAYVDEIDRGRRLRTAGIAVLTTALFVATGGVIRLAVQARRRARGVARRSGAQPFVR